MIVGWAISIVLLAVFVLAVFGAVAPHFLKPTPAVRFCSRLGRWLEIANMKFAKAVMVVILLLLVIVIIAKLAFG